MRAAPRSTTVTNEWRPTPDPPERFSSGIPDFDRMIGGGFRRGSFALLSLDESVRREDVDLVTFPTFLNTLYHSRGIVAILPSNDSPHEFRARLTRFATRRRFDSRVRVMDYVGEDEGPPYVVNFRAAGATPSEKETTPRARKAVIAQAVAAEKAAQGQRGRPFLEVVALEIFETLMGAEAATKTYFLGVKRSRQLGNLALGILGPGLGCAAAMRRMADVEFALHRDEVGLSIRGVHPAFPRHLVTPDRVAGPPHVALVPPPA